MRLYLMRHAEAFPSSLPSIADDAVRPLTDSGRTQARRSVEGLRRLKLDIRMIVTSPFRRAIETAKEAADVLEMKVAIREWPELTPDTDPKETSRRLGELSTTAGVLFVGHEPHMSSWISELVSEGAVQCLMKKAAVACIQVDKLPPPTGNGELRWLLSPKQLALIGKSTA